LNTSSTANIKRIHIEPLGGISGDMFVASILHAFSDVYSSLICDLEKSGIMKNFDIELISHNDHTFSGNRIKISQKKENYKDVKWSDLKYELSKLTLPKKTIERAIDIFSLLAEAESRVHGVKTEDITFHEVGAWDSIADILSAAWLVDHIGTTNWSVASLPLGSGSIKTKHGQIPIPAPAVIELIKGFRCYDDGITGERVTPTGAAILAHLKPTQKSLKQEAILTRVGIGFGSQSFPGMSNILRTIVFTDEPKQSDIFNEEIAILSFDVDDQTPEDLSVALDKIRNIDGIKDVSQTTRFGKKGRILIGVKLLCDVESIEKFLNICFSETTTLGIRWQITNRSSLKRNILKKNSRGVRVKKSYRPNGEVTLKAEMDDLKIHNNYKKREKVRKESEKQKK